jgi:hypothetical protein
VARVFISYKHGAQPDVRLAGGLANRLRAEGHKVFIDTDLQVGQKWPDLIEDSLKSSDHFVILLSEPSVSSEMVFKESSIAYARYKREGAPILLPVRLAYEEPLPYAMGAWLDNIQHAKWTTEADDATIFDQIAAAVAGQAVASAAQSALNRFPVVLSADGNAANEAIPAPLPSFDPRWLDMLDDPTGAVRLKSPFYIERDMDTHLKDAIARRGITIRLKGTRQTGKSSALARLFQNTRDEKQPSVYVDFQRIDEDDTKDLNSLLRYLAEFFAAKLKTNESPAVYWNSGLGAKDKLTTFIEDQVIDADRDKPIILMLDSVDRLFSYGYRNDFFGLIRSWHDNRAFDERWDRLNLLLSYATEATTLIQDQTQSPFNVGEGFETADFDRRQLELLNVKHGGPLNTDTHIDCIMQLLEGHPYLVRRSLYCLARQHWTYERLMEHAIDDDGPFGDHLRSYIWWLKGRPNSRAELRSALKDGECATEEEFFRLRSAGLIRGHSRAKVTLRCGLYRKYLENRL